MSPFTVAAIIVGGLGFILGVIAVLHEPKAARLALLHKLSRDAVWACEQVSKVEKMTSTQKYAWAATALDALVGRFGLSIPEPEMQALIESAVADLNDFAGKLFEHKDNAATPVDNKPEK